MLLPARLELVGRAMIWRVRGQRPGQARQKCLEGRNIVFCTPVCFALPAEGFGE